MSQPRWRFGVAGRLALLLGSLAAASTLIALLIQDRALSSDLRYAAQQRLGNAGRATDRQIADYLRGVADRYEAISRTPEFRANLAANHLPTLNYYARQLAESQEATAIVFLRRSGSIATRVGDRELARAAAQRVVRDSTGDEPVCVRSGQDDLADRRPPTGDRLYFEPCQFPNVGAEASILAADTALYALVAIPLRTSGVRDGGLVALEPINAAVFGAWSEMFGAAIHAAPPDTPPAHGLEERVRAFPDVEIRVSTTYDAEHRAIARSRQNLLLSGAGALFLAVVASLIIARRFAQPIVKMTSAAERVGEGFLDPDLDVKRHDELGDLGRAFQDIMSRLRGSEMQLGRAQRQARLDHWAIDLETDDVSGGPEFRRLFGLPKEGPIQIEDLALRVHGDDRDKFKAAIRRARATSGTFRTDVRVPLRPGRDRILHLRGRRRDGRNGDKRVVASVQDVTERWRTAKRIKYLSLHDALTGLGNREYFYRDLRRQLKSAGKAQCSVAVFTVGINDFGSITGAMGDAVAAELLREAGSRLVSTLTGDRAKRETPTGDGSRGSVTRLGDAEFAVVTQLDARDEAAYLADTILRRLADPFSIGEQDVPVNASIGISLWPDDAADVETLTRNCQSALQQSRLAGHNQYRFYDGSRHREASRLLRMAVLLRRAIENGDLEVYYQPRVRPDSEAIVAVEALARWTSDELGTVEPSEFIPLAEEAGLVRPLGEFCLRVVARDLARWRELGAHSLRVAVNISQQQLTRGIVEGILDATSGVEPSDLELEVTESALIDRPEEALAVLNELGEHGFRISLDDFGTGYSSLSYIRQLPIDAVKIDRSFIKELATSDDAHAITWTIIMMCQALSLEAVAEGVETKAQQQVLVELGCDEAQGYLFGRPMSAARLEKHLVKQGVIEKQLTVA
ncbi:MAG: EAL domain-containing protein [Gemmatimonadota bacterium]|nr:MAG: EAL domain-containing protein [Gemmatimonadota bacterium]